LGENSAMTARVDSKKLAAELQICEEAAQKIIGSNFVGLTEQLSAESASRDGVFLRKHRTTLIQAP